MVRQESFDRSNLLIGGRVQGKAPIDDASMSMQMLEDQFPEIAVIVMRILCSATAIARTSSSGRPGGQSLPTRVASWPTPFRKTPILA
jgi:hypothetical protein